MSYPRYNNGHVDTGKAITKRCCPNCNSNRFVETVSREHCPACGLTCDYWGGGANSVYEDMMERRYLAEEREREQEDERIRREEGW